MEEFIKYLPKIIKNKVKHTYIEPDFDYSKNRSVQHYYVILDDDTSFDATTIKELKEKANQLIRNKLL